MSCIRYEVRCASSAAFTVARMSALTMSGRLDHRSMTACSSGSTEVLPSESAPYFAPLSFAVAVSPAFSAVVRFLSSPLYNFATLSQKLVSVITVRDSLLEVFDLHELVRDFLGVKGLVETLRASKG